MTPDENVVAHLPMLRRWSGRFARNMPAFVERDDLEQEAAIAMLVVARGHPAESWAEIAGLCYCAAWRRMGAEFRYWHRQGRDSGTMNDHVDPEDLLTPAPVNIVLRLTMAEQLATLSAADQLLLHRRYWMRESAEEVAGESPLPANTFQGALRRCRELAW